MNLEVLHQSWRSASILRRVAVVVVVVVVLGFAIGVGAKGWEDFRGRQFDKKEAEQEKKVQALDAQIEALTVRAERAEAKGELAGQKADALEAVNKQQGAKAEAEARKVEEAFKAYENDQAITDGDVADDVRRQRICDKRKELGYPCY